MICPVCGTVPVPGAQFCHSCGAALPAAGSAPATERRVVTVLFGDLSDFTGWAEDLDPEHVGAVTDRVLAALARAVTMFGGHVDKLTGDGIMAVFGAPVAHEDDSERAVRAALAMQRAVRKVLDVEQGGGVPLGLRVGLNTGVVVAGVQASLEYTVVGDTVNTAARLADAATIGAVYAGARTASTTRHLAAWRQLRPLRLKGKREPVQAYELLGLRDAPGTRSGLGDEAPFVGREAEIGRFASRLAEVVDGRQPSVMVMTAEAGVGKTRFAAEASRHAADNGARVLSVRCAAYGEHRRLAPLADLVRVAAGLSVDDNGDVDAATVAARLIRLANRIDRARLAERAAEADPSVNLKVEGTLQAQRLADQSPTPALQVDLLLGLLGYSDQHPGQERDQAAESSDETHSGVGAHVEDGQTIPEAVAELCTGLARESPLVVIVDDLHDATAEALDALSIAIAGISGRVLVLLQGRPELVRVKALSRLAGAEVHSLPPLRGADAARLLKVYLGGGRLEPADENRLLATAQGNPFYLAELVALLVERGMLTRSGAGWRLAPGSLGGKLLSRDLAAVLTARIDALPPAARALLRDAAVVGDSVPEGALETLQHGPRTGVAAVARESALKELLARRMLRRRGAGGYAFVTPLMREAAYSGVGRAVLAAQHAELARWGAAQRDRAMPAEAADAFTASHAERAITVADSVGLRSDADPRSVATLGVAALTRLADRALATGDPADAVRWEERGMALAGGTLPAADRLVHARALLQLGRAAEARAAAEKVVANTPPGPNRVDALLLLGEAHRALGELRQAADAWQEALAEAAGSGLPVQQAEATYRLGMTDYLGGRLRQAQTRFEAAHEIAVAAHDRRGQAWAQQHLAWVLATQGDFTAADAAMVHATRLFAELDDPFDRAWIRGATGFIRLFTGRFREAKRLAYAFLPFGERVNENWAVCTLRAVAGYAAAQLGSLDEAEKQTIRAYRGFDHTSDDWGRSLALVAHAEICSGRGDAARSVRLLDRAATHANDASHGFMAAMAHAARGFAHLDAGDVDAAQADARRSLELAEQHELRAATRVGAAVLLADTCRLQGDADASLDVLAGVMEEQAGESLIFPWRRAVSAQAAALLAAGRAVEAVSAAERAVATPAEDVRSAVVSHRVHAEALAATGELESARQAARRAVDLAYGTELVNERAAADELLARLS
ncbi:MAG: adenylate/guanylate cyclase domain-containing protein [Micromonosporaceae bacterium]